jgi:hypothetical protein
MAKPDIEPRSDNCSAYIDAVGDSRAVVGQKCGSHSVRRCLASTLAAPLRAVGEEVDGPVFGYDAHELEIYGRCPRLGVGEEKRSISYTVGRDGKLRKKI